MRRVPTAPVLLMLATQDLRPDPLPDLRTVLRPSGRRTRIDGTRHGHRNIATALAGLHPALPDPLPPDVPRAPQTRNRAEPVRRPGKADVGHRPANAEGPVKAVNSHMAALGLSRMNRRNVTRVHGANDLGRPLRACDCGMGWADPVEVFHPVCVVRAVSQRRDPPAALGQDTARPPMSCPNRHRAPRGRRMTALA